MTNNSSFSLRFHHKRDGARLKRGKERSGRNTSAKIVGPRARRR